MPPGNRVRAALAVVRFIWSHPANRDHRRRQLARSLRFEVLSRTLGSTTEFDLGGARFIADRRHDASVRAYHASPPDWAEMFAWRRHLAAGDLFVDVGANVGTYSLWALAHGCEVVAIEPGADARTSLIHHLELNDFRAEVVAAAAGARSGSVAITSSNKSSSNRVGADGYRVPVVTVDSVVGHRFVAGLKIDVEGFEREVLEGAIQCLSERRVAMLQVEWNTLSRDVLGESRGPIIDLLGRFGYKLYYAVRDGDLEPIEGEPDSYPGCPDVMALPA